MSASVRCLPVSFLRLAFVAYCCLQQDIAHVSVHLHLPAVLVHYRYMQNQKLQYAIYTVKGSLAGGSDNVSLCLL